MSSSVEVRKSFLWENQSCELISLPDVERFAPDMGLINAFPGGMLHHMLSYCKFVLMSSPLRKTISLQSRVLYFSMCEQGMFFITFIFLHSSHYFTLGLHSHSSSSHPPTVPKRVYPSAFQTSPLLWASSLSKVKHIFSPWGHTRQFFGVYVLRA